MIANNLSKWSLAYWQEGWNVIPLGGDDGKKAMVSWKRWETERQSRADVEGMDWKSAMGIGGILGPVSNLACIEVDNEFIAQRFLDIKITTDRTPKGSIHLLIRPKRPEDIRNIPAEEGLGFEVLWEGRYIRLPHSRDPDGREVERIKDLPPMGVEDWNAFIDAHSLTKPKRKGSLENWKNKIELKQVIGRYMELEDKHGGYSLGLCPFHDDHHPSLVVYPPNFHCFGCNAHGDVIDFIERIEGLEFEEAVKKICELTGIESPLEKRMGLMEMKEDFVELMGIADRELELFHDERKVPYAIFKRGEDGAKIHLPISSDGMKNWLIYQFYTDSGRAPGTDDLNKVLSILSVKAIFEGPERELSNRVCWHEGKFYYDLADERWRAVEIDEDGYRVVENPVLFRRYSHQMAQVEPVQAEPGEIDLLDPFLNLDEGCVMNA